MTQWAPVWRVKIDGTDVTDSVLANLTITSGRTNIYEQAQAGYCSINLTVNGAIDAEGTARTIVKTLNDSFYRGTGGASALQAI